MLIYGFSEPLVRFYRLRWLRLEQVNLAIELRTTLIREARERKDARKDRRIKSFERWTVEFGRNSYGATAGDEQENEEAEAAEQQETKSIS